MRYYIRTYIFHSTGGCCHDKMSRTVQLMSMSLHWGRKMTGGANHAEPCKIVEASQTTSRGGLVQNLGQTESHRVTAQPLTWSAARQTDQLGVLHYAPKSNKQHYCSVVVLCIFGSYLYTTPCHAPLKLVKPFDGTKNAAPLWIASSGRLRFFHFANTKCWRELGNSNFREKSKAPLVHFTETQGRNVREQVPDYC